MLRVPGRYMEKVEDGTNLLHDVTEMIDSLEERNGQVLEVQSVALPPSQQAIPSTDPSINAVDNDLENVGDSKLRSTTTRHIWLLNSHHLRETRDSLKSLAPSNSTEVTRGSVLFRFHLLFLDTYTIPHQKRVIHKAALGHLVYHIVWCSQPTCIWHRQWQSMHFPITFMALQNDSLSGTGKKHFRVVRIGLQDCSYWIFI